MKGAVNEWGQKVFRHELIRKMFFANQLSGQKSRFSLVDVSNLSSSENDWPVGWFAAAFLMISLHGTCAQKPHVSLQKQEQGDNS
jgi:hypothetical protein